MKEFVVKWENQGVVKEIEVSQPAFGGNCYHIYINRFFEGRFIRYSTEIRLCLSTFAALTGDEYGELQEMIRECDPEFFNLKG